MTAYSRCLPRTYVGWYDMLAVVAKHSDQRITSSDIRDAALAALLAQAGGEDAISAACRLLTYPDDMTVQ